MGAKWRPGCGVTKEGRQNEKKRRRALRSIEARSGVGGEIRWKKNWHQRIADTNHKREEGEARGLGEIGHLKKKNNNTCKTKKNQKAPTQGGGLRTASWGGEVNPRPEETEKRSRRTGRKERLVNAWATRGGPRPRENKKKPASEKKVGRGKKKPEKYSKARGNVIAGGRRPGQLGRIQGILAKT